MLPLWALPAASGKRLAFVFFARINPFEIQGVLEKRTGTFLPISRNMSQFVTKCWIGMVRVRFQIVRRELDQRRSSLKLGHDCPDGSRRVDRKHLMFHRACPYLWWQIS